jgi:RimJ/RimL family protein N-acetyltransferase
LQVIQVTIVYKNFNNNMFFIASERLKLIPLTHELLQLCHTNRAAMEQRIGLHVSRMQVTPEYQAEIDDAMLNFWLPQTLEHPDKYFWYTSWEIVLKSTNTSIGGIGFAGYPNEHGETQVGYMIDGQQQRKGYATEALQTIVAWAFQQQGVQSVIAQTPPDNFASQATLLKNGFIADGAGEEGMLRFRRAKRLAV